MTLADARIEGGTLIFIRDLPHPPAAVWRALTDPAELDRWAPFTAGRGLGTTGPAQLTMVDGDDRIPMAAVVKTAVEPTLLEYTWGDDLLRWELEPAEGGTRLKLRHTFAQPGLGAVLAAGWDLCTGVLGELLDGKPVAAIRGRDAMNHGWEDLRAGYAARFTG